MDKIRVCVWNEYEHEVSSEEVAAVYPEGIHNAIGDYLKKDGRFEVSTAVQAEPEHGLTERRLNDTDVLIWWGHMKHGDVSDEIVERVYRRIMEGMGFIALHSGHASKIFARLCGTSSDNLKWRENNDKEILWVVNPAHPIAEGLEKDHIVLPAEEMYGERFDIPEPDELIFISWFSGGYVFRSGFTLKRGLGKVFYFRPGHESFPTFRNPEIMKVISNAVKWCAPTEFIRPKYGHFPDDMT